MTKQLHVYSDLYLVSFLALASVVVVSLIAPPGSVVASPTSAIGAVIVERQIAIHDESLGDTSFDAIAAGYPNPAAEGKNV